MLGLLKGMRPRDLGRAVVSDAFDDRFEGEVTFIRQVPAALAAPATLRQYAGQYLTPSGSVFSVVLQENGTLGLDFAGQPFQVLTPWQPHRFKVKEFSDVTFEFVLEDGRVTALKQIDPSGEYIFRRK